jgi:hypothetical protein
MEVSIQQARQQRAAGRQTGKGAARETHVGHGPVAGNVEIDRDWWKPMLDEEVEAFYRGDY